MRKKIGMTVVLIIVMVLVLSAVGVYGAEEDLYKNLEEAAKQSGNNYFLKYRDNYELDTEEMSFFKEPSSVMLNLLSSFVFLLQKMLAQITIAIFSFALSNNITQMLGQLVSPFIAAMKSSLWDNLAIYAISFAAFVMLLKMLQNRTSQALSSLISLVLIIALAFTFYNYPIEMLDGVDLVVSGVADEIMEGPYSQAIGGTASDATGKASELCWNLFVHKPWQILNFDSVKMAEKYQDDIIKLEPASDKRVEKVEELAKSDNLFSKAAGYQGSRLATSIVLLLFNLILMAVIITFSVLIIGYRFLLLIYLLLGALVFLVALVPECGVGLIKKWGLRIIGISFTRVMIVFFLSLTMIFMDSIYQFVDKDGYGLLIIMFLMIVTVAAIWFERHRFLELFTTYQSNINQFPQVMNRSMETEFNAVAQIRHIRSSSLNSSGNFRSPGAVEDNEENSIYRAGSASNQRSSLRVGNTSYENQAGVDSMNLSGEKLQQSADNLRSVSQDMQLYYKQAEALLEKHYEYSKAKSEETAKVKNEPVGYDGFVKRTDQIRSKQRGNFDRKDISQVANLMKGAVRQGGGIDEIVTDGVSIGRKNVSERPSSLMSVRNMDINDGMHENRQIKPPKGIDYFKSNFGQEQGEEMYERLQAQYGNEKLENYRPFYNNNGKQSYAQVVKQLRENKVAEAPQYKSEGKAVQQQSAAAQKPMPNKTVKPQEPIKLRGGEIHDKQ